MVAMVRSAEEGEEGGEGRGEDAGHFDSAPWMSEQREGQVGATASLWRRSW